MLQVMVLQRLVQTMTTAISKIKLSLFDFDKISLKNTEGVEN